MKLSLAFLWQSSPMLSSLYVKEIFQCKVVLTSVGFVAKMARVTDCKNLGTLGGMMTNKTTFLNESRLGKDYPICSLISKGAKASGIIFVLSLPMEPRQVLSYL